MFGTVANRTEIYLQQSQKSAFWGLVKVLAGNGKYC